MKVKAAILVAILLLVPLSSAASVGFKVGMNFANITKASSVNGSSYTGFMAGVFWGPGRGQLLGFQSELVFSRQGYDFSANATTGTVKLDYLLFPNLLTLNLAGIVRGFAGLQLAYLLKASVTGAGPADPTPSSVIDLFNRLDFGLAFGAEFSPFLGILAGARLNLSFGNLFKNPGSSGTASYFPGIDSKNNVFQLYAGWRF